MADGAQLMRLHALHARAEEMELAGHVLVVDVNSFGGAACHTLSFCGVESRCARCEK